MTVNDKIKTIEQNKAQRNVRKNEFLTGKDALTEKGLLKKSQKLND